MLCGSCSCEWVSFKNRIQNGWVGKIKGRARHTQAPLDQTRKSAEYHRIKRYTEENETARERGMDR